MKNYLVILGFFLFVKMEAQTPNSYPSTGETVIGGHFHAGASNEVWTDATSLLFNYRGKGASTYFWNLGGSTGRSLLSILNTGNVGIGTTNPLSRLDLGELRFDAISKFPAEGSILEGTWGNYIIGDVNSSQRLRFGVSNDGYSRAEINIDNSNRVDGYIQFKTTDSNGGAISRMQIKGNGNVGIGVDNPQNKLDVNGTVHAKEVKVDLTGWSDFVFQPSYKLKSLAEVEQYIKANRHLENIPSTEDVMQNGVNVGEMQTKLLQKIEELTLYVIELKKEIETLKK